MGWPTDKWSELDGTWSARVSGSPQPQRSLLLMGGEYEASLTQAWAATEGQHATATGSLMVAGPVSSMRAAALITLAAVAVGVPGRVAPAVVGRAAGGGLPPTGLGLLSWLDTWRMTLLADGSLSQP